MGTVIVFLVIAKLLHPRGACVSICACLFVASLVATQLSVKTLYSPPYEFAFPALLTTLHFSLVTAASVMYWYAVGHPEKIHPNSLGLGRFVQAILPIAFSYPASVIFNNTALLFVGTGLCAVFATLSPVSTALLSRLFGRKLSKTSWCGVSVAFVGAVVISWSEVAAVHRTGTSKDFVHGILFLFFALFARSIKIVLMDNLLAPKAYARRSEDAVSPMHLYVLQMPLCAAMSALYALSTEDVGEAWNQLTPRVIGVILCTCINALALNFLGLFVLRDLGATPQQIVGKLNTVCIAALSVAFLGESFPLPVFLGSCLVLSGVVIFEYGESGNESFVGNGHKDQELIVRIEANDSDAGALSDGP